MTNFAKKNNLWVVRGSQRFQLQHTWVARILGHTLWTFYKVCTWTWIPNTSISFLISWSIMWKVLDDLCVCVWWSSNNRQDNSRAVETWVTYNNYFDKIPDLGWMFKPPNVVKDKLWDGKMRIMTTCVEHIYFYLKPNESSNMGQKHQLV